MFIRNLGSSVTKEILKDKFSAWGQIEFVFVSKRDTIHNYSFKSIENILRKYLFIIDKFDFINLFRRISFMINDI